ncbi:MAG: [protein-PII] uridylyltransferase [Cumulibacter sp.]
MAPTPSEGLTKVGPSIREARNRLLANSHLVGRELRRRLTELYDGWLTELVPADRPVALVAVGGLGREEPAPHSDLDLVLLHDLRRSQVAEVADAIWYPVWDSGLGLDHSVRTVRETATLAASDIKVSLGMLDLRFIAGSAEIAAEARGRVAEAWRVNAATRAAELQLMIRERADLFGQVAYLLQPDLKQSYGGLRDATILRALARAQLIDVRRGLDDAVNLLLDVRGEVHRHAGKRNDLLLAQDRPAIAEALGIDSATQLLREVNSAGRTIAYALDSAFRRAARRRAEEPASLRERLRRPSRVGSLRRGLAKDVVAQNGEVVLARSASPASDVGLLLRVARAAANADLPISTFTLDRLRIEGPADLGLWSEEMRRDLDALLAAGAPMLAVWDSLDQHGLLERLLPEWRHVRSLPQHNAVHVFTVDRHLLQTVLETDVVDVQSSRPDLVRISALLHDLGKGQPGDHSVVGARIAGAVMARMGFSERDREVVQRVVLHHLLLSTTAQRRDLSDPRTVEQVIDSLGPSPLVVDLLHALTLADARATGPGAHSPWKTALQVELVTRVKATMAGEIVEDLDVIDDLAGHVLGAAPDEPFAMVIGRAPGAYQQLLVAIRDERVRVSSVAGVLALRSVTIQRARLTDVDGTLLLDLIVEPQFGSMPAAVELTEQLRRATDGALDLTERLAEKAAAYDKPRSRPMTVRWPEGAATDASVVEVLASDRTALLFQLLQAIEEAGVRVRAAVIESYGPTVVDAFYLQRGGARPLTADDCLGVQRRLAALDS